MLQRTTTRAIPRRLAAAARAQQQSRTLFGRRRGGPGSYSGRPVESFNIERLAQERENYYTLRRYFLIAGAVAGVISFAFTAYRLKKELDKKPPIQSDVGQLPPSDPLAVPSSSGRKVIVHDEEGHEFVPTGVSSLPFFPRTIDMPTFEGEQPATTSSAPAPTAGATAPAPTTEYTLVGLGTRTVTFLGIQVYVVGFYIATADIATLQSKLIKRVNPIATTLIAGEKDELRAALLDPDESEAVWDELLREGAVARSAFRIVPIRDTDFHHLRDAFVRAVNARSERLIAESAAGAAPVLPNEKGLDTAAAQESFGESMRNFRTIFNRGKIPRGKELMLVRERGGLLRVVYSDDSDARHRKLIGAVDDERLSRALWLNYLAGKKVSSEPARQNVVDGIMEFVERPVGTVATQVV